LIVDTELRNYRYYRKQSDNSPSMVRTCTLDLARGVAQLPSTENVEAQHGSDEQDAPMADFERTSILGQESGNCPDVC